MDARLLLAEHRGRIVNVTCARRHHDLAYLPVHRRLEWRFANYRYIGLTTREPENLVSTSPGYVGKRYLQDYFSSGDFERDTGLRLVPEQSHVFLCGSPEMIGAPLHSHDRGRRYPATLGMVEVLERRGFEMDQPHQPGRVHWEHYW
jgi:ferredoxin--NADP+ reductase